MLLAGLAAPAPAQEWPQKTIRIIVAFGPGGGSDIVSRIIGQSMQEKLGQSVIIENKPGAGGTLGNEIVARADKDGYTHRHHDRRPDHRRGHEQVAALRHADGVRPDRAGRDRRAADVDAPGFCRPTT